jgi:4-aminobutyrate aminotransferase-like enzyme
VAGAAVIATLKVIERDQLRDRATVLGQVIQARVDGWRRAGHGPSDARGRGALIGLEFMDHQGGPDRERVSQIKHLALESGLVVISCGLDDNVIRLLPPLTVSDAELTQGLDILEAAVMETGRAG